MIRMLSFEYIKLYTKSLCKVDLHYRHLVTSYDQIENPIDKRSNYAVVWNRTTNKVILPKANKQNGSLRAFKKVRNFSGRFKDNSIRNCL